MTEICKIEGCRRPRKALGMCVPHYARFRRGCSQEEFLRPIGERLSKLPAKIERWQTAKASR